MMLYRLPLNLYIYECRTPTTGQRRIPCRGGVRQLHGQETFLATFGKDVIAKEMCGVLALKYDVLMSGTSSATT